MEDMCDMFDLFKANLKGDSPADIVDAFAVVNRCVISAKEFGLEEASNVIDFVHWFRDTYVNTDGMDDAILARFEGVPYLLDQYDAISAYVDEEIGKTFWKFLPDTGREWVNKLTHGIWDQDGSLEVYFFRGEDDNVDVALWTRPELMPEEEQHEALKSLNRTLVEWVLFGGYAINCVVTKDTCMQSGFLFSGESEGHEVHAMTGDEVEKYAAKFLPKNCGTCSRHVVYGYALIP